MQDIDQLRTRSVEETAEPLGVSRDTVNTLLRRRDWGATRSGSAGDRRRHIKKI